MANEEQLSILKQGVEVWNKWREENPDVQVKLNNSNISDLDLRGINLRDAYLSDFVFDNSNFSYAKFDRIRISLGTFTNASLTAASFSESVVFRVNFKNSDLRNAKFDRANASLSSITSSILHETDFEGAKFFGCNLRSTDLTRANLFDVNFLDVDLVDTIFRGAQVGHTVFGNINLNKVIGLEDVLHRFPSTIGNDTFQKSQGKIPEVFLQGCGLSDWEIEMAKLYDPDLSNNERNKILYKIYDLQASQAIQISPLFISYSHGDGTFVDKLESQLNKKGVRFWRDIHDMKSGRMETQIDRAISQNPTVLLVLSKNSLSSDWVEHEVRTARELEKEIGRDTLCPVALDDSWKSSRWPKRVMEQIMEYNILDFSEWKDDVKFEGMFRKLIDGLELFYKG